MVIESYTKRITRLKQRVGESDPQGLERLQIEALHWEKDYLKSLLAELKMHPLDDAAEQDMRVEACERMMDDIMNTLRHTSPVSSSGACARSNVVRRISDGASAARSGVPRH